MDRNEATEKAREIANQFWWDSAGKMPSKQHFREAIARALIETHNAAVEKARTEVRNQARYLLTVAMQTAWRDNTSIKGAFIDRIRWIRKAALRVSALRIAEEGG